MRKIEEVQTACFKFQRFSYSGDGAGAKNQNEPEKEGEQ